MVYNHTLVPLAGTIKINRIHGPLANTGRLCQYGLGYGMDTETFSGRFLHAMVHDRGDTYTSHTYHCPNLGDIYDHRKQRLLFILQHYEICKSASLSKLSAVRVSSQDLRERDRAGHYRETERERERVYLDTRT